MTNEVLRRMTKPDAKENDLLYLFYPETDTAHASRFEHLTNISTRLAAGNPAVSEAAATAQLRVIDKVMSETLRSRVRR
jgi:hypothetical protein